MKTASTAQSQQPRTDDESPTYQVVFTSNGTSVERLYDEASARRMFAIATSGPHYDAVSLELWDGIAFTAVEEWTREAA